MAVLDHDHPISSPSQNHCAVQFCLTWAGFFVVVALMTWIASAL